LSAVEAVVEVGVEMMSLVASTVRNGPLLACYYNSEPTENYLQRARENEGNRGSSRTALLYASAAQRKPELPVELSGVFELRAATL
jgi:hypothetical protein